MDLDDKYFHLNKLNKKTGHKHYKTYKSMELKLSNLNLLPYFFNKINHSQKSTKLALHKHTKN